MSKKKKKKKKLFSEPLQLNTLRIDEFLEDGILIRSIQNKVFTKQNFKNKQKNSILSIPIEQMNWESTRTDTRVLPMKWILLSLNWPVIKECRIFTMPSIYYFQQPNTHWQRDGKHPKKNNIFFCYGDAIGNIFFVQQFC